jgi:phenylalanyl-tRNA synthetase beta chain
MGSDLKLYNIVDNYPSEIKKVNVNFDRNKIDKLLGCSIPAGEIDKILNRLPVKEVEKNVFEVCSSRKDLNIEVDFVEEIAKFYGYDNIEPKVIKMECTPYYNKLEKYFTISNKLSSLGFYEVKNFSLVNSEKDNSPKLVNPLSEEMKFMRTNMWEGMIKNVEYNAKRGMENHAYFETGKVYIHKNNEFFEENVASVVVAGNIFEMPGNNIKADYYYTKSVLESVLSGKKLTYRKNTIKEYLHPGISAEICVGDDVVGYIGKLHPSIKSKYFKDVFYFEFYPERLEGKKDFKIKQLSIFPTSKFDLSLIVPEKSTYQDIIMSIEKLKIEELDEIKLYDFYQGEKIPEGTISMTFRLKFTNVEKTLNDEEINEKISKILKTLKEIDVTLRAE